MYSILHLFQQAKFVVSHVKRNSSSYNRWFTKFPLEKAPSQFPFPYLTTPTKCFVFPPDAWPFNFSNASHSDLLCACNHEPLGNWSVSAYSLFRLLSSTAMVLHGDSLSLSYTSAKRSVFLHAVAFWSLLHAHLQSIDKHHPLGLRYKI